MTSTWPVDLAGPSAVYRVYGAADGLLYIGFTGNVYKRLAWHERHSPWWPGNGASHTAEWFATRDDAALAEAIAIVLECPRHNTRRDRYRFVDGRMVDLATFPRPAAIPAPDGRRPARRR